MFILYIKKLLDSVKKICCFSSLENTNLKKKRKILLNDYPLISDETSFLNPYKNENVKKTKQMNQRKLYLLKTFFTLPP